MMKKNKKTLRIIVSIVCFFVSVLFLAFLLLRFSVENHKREVTVFTFKSGVVLPVKELQEKYIKKGSLEIDYGNRHLKLALTSEGRKITAKLTAFPGQNSYYKGDVLLFTANKITEGYSLASCRMETLPDKVTLLPDNLDAAGHTILSLGFRNDKTQDVYYTQLCIDDFNIDAILMDADENFADSNYTEEDLLDLELKYITLMR